MSEDGRERKPPDYDWSDARPEVIAYERRLEDQQKGKHKQKGGPNYLLWRQVTTCEARDGIQNSDYNCEYSIHLSYPTCFIHMR